MFTIIQFAKIQKKIEISREQTNSSQKFIFFGSDGSALYNAESTPARKCKKHFAFCSLNRTFASKSSN
jgi:hypothetical protein